MLFLWRWRAAVASSNLIVGTSNSLKKRAKVFVMNLNTEKKRINKYYTRECISLFDGVESVVSVRFQVDTWLFGYDC